MRLDRALATQDEVLAKAAKRLGFLYTEPPPLPTTPMLP